MKSITSFFKVLGVFLLVAIAVGIFWGAMSIASSFGAIVGFAFIALVIVRLRQHPGW